MRNFTIACGLFGLFLLGNVGACGGAVGDKVRPPDFTAAGATGTAAAACTGSPALARPLTVDLESDMRQELDVAMRTGGLVVVSYDCKALRVMSGCKLAAARYDYMGTDRTEDVLRLKNQDELSVNLPFSSVKLGGELRSGRTIDLAIVLVGLKSTTVTRVDRKDLEGECEGATHFLQVASVGAFSMATGSVGKVVVAADVFKVVGASGGSESSRDTGKLGGSIDACRKSNGDSTMPPQDCGAPVRVKLLPLGGAETAAAPKAPPKGEKAKGAKDPDAALPVENPCQPGYQFAGGICTRAPDAAFLCKAKDREECKTQCEKGSAASCYNYADLMPRRTPELERAAFYKKACDGGFGDGCAWYSVFARPEKWGLSALAQWKDVRDVAAQGCAMGSGISCENLGDILSSPVDFPDFIDATASTKAYVRGCMLGDGTSCSVASAAYLSGDGVAASPAKAVELLDRACQSGANDQCADLAELLYEGNDGVPKDLPRAFPIARRACKKDTMYCTLAVKIGIDSKQDDKTIFGLADRGCPDDVDSCVILGELYEGGRGTTKDADKARQLWTTACKESEDEAACKHLGAGKKATARSSAKAPAKTAAKGAPKAPGKPAAKKK
jgi:uncharacterized protein